MRNAKSVPIVVVAALLYPLMVFGQAIQRSRPNEVEAATAAAHEGMQRFAALVTKDNYAAMGFDSPEQVRSATLGVPVEQYAIGLEDVLRYKAPGDLPQMVKAGERVTFPVLVEGRTRSSVTVRRQNGRWTPESFGAPQYVRMLSEVRERLAAEKQRPVSEYFEVRILALNLTFVGHAQDAQLFLALVHDAPGVDLKRGVLIPADEVMKVIEPLARAHNRLPT